MTSYSWSLTLINNVDGAIQSVMFPSYALRQGDMPGMRALLLKTISSSTYFVFPLMVGLACTAEPIIWLVLGEQWMGAVPFMVFYCAISVLFPFQTAGLQALNAVGRSDIYFRVIAIKRIAGLVLLGIAALVFDTPFAILSAAFLGEVIGTAVSAVPLSSVLKISVCDQLRVCFPNAAMALLMGTCVYAVKIFTLPYASALVFQIVVGIVIYSALSFIFKNPNFDMVKAFVGNRMRR